MAAAARLVSPFGAALGRSRASVLRLTISALAMDAAVATLSASTPSPSPASPTPASPTPASPSPGETFCSGDLVPPSLGSCDELAGEDFCSLAAASRRRTWGGEAADYCQTTCSDSLPCQPSTPSPSVPACDPDDASRRRSGHACTDFLDEGLCAVAASSRRRRFGGEAADYCHTTCASDLACASSTTSGTTTQTRTATTTSPVAACSRPDGWCTHPNVTYADDADCDGDGVADPHCHDANGYAGFLGSASGCSDTWPDGGCQAPTPAETQVPTPAPTPAPLETVLEQPANASSGELVVLVEDGFAVGDVIQICEGKGDAMVCETRTIVGFGTIILDEPLTRDFSAGATVTQLIVTTTATTTATATVTATVTDTDTDTATDTDTGTTTATATVTDTDTGTTTATATATDTAPDTGTTTATATATGTDTGTATRTTTRTRTATRTRSATGESPAPTAAPAETTLESPANASSNILVVLAEDGFAVGDVIQICEGKGEAMFCDTRTIVGFGTIILDEPLTASFSAGATVTQLVATSTTTATATATATDTVTDTDTGTTTRTATLTRTATRTRSASGETPAPTTAAPVQTALDSPAYANQSVLVVLAEDGFAVGDAIQICEGEGDAMFCETRTIVGFGTIILNEPLTRDFSAGASVTQLVAATTATATATLTGTVTVTGGFVCQSTAGNATNPTGYACADYAENVWLCDDYDDFDFTGSLMCCECGGGVQVPATLAPTAAPPTPMPTAATLLFSAGAGCLSGSQGNSGLVDTPENCTAFVREGARFRSVAHGWQCLELFGGHLGAEWGLWECDYKREWQEFGQDEGGRWCATRNGSTACLEEYQAGLPTPPPSRVPTPPPTTARPPPPTPAPAPAPALTVEDIDAVEEDLLLSLRSGNQSRLTVSVGGTTFVAQAISAEDAIRAGLSSVEVDVGGGAEVSVPTTLFGVLGDVDVVVIAAAIPATSFVNRTQDDSGESVQVLTALSVNVASLGSGVFYDVSGLDDPILVTLPNVTEGSASCAYWDEETMQWSAEGVSMLANADGTLTCATSHLTIFGAILKGFISTLECSQARLLSKEGYDELLKGEWLSLPGTGLLWGFLALMLGMLLLAALLDARDRRLGYAWDAELFLVPDSEQPVDEDEEDHEGGFCRTLCCIVGITVVSSAIRDVIDDFASNAFAYFGDVRGMLEVLLENVQEAWAEGNGMEAFAAGVLARSAARQACASMYLHRDDMDFLHDEDIEEELKEEEEDNRCSSKGSADSAAVPPGSLGMERSAEEPAPNPGDPEGSPTVAADDPLERTKSPDLEQVGNRAQSGSALSSNTSKTTIAQLAASNKMAKLRFDKLSELRLQLRQKHAKGTSHHGSWKSFPKLILTSFFLHGPLGSVFSRSILVSRAMRALFLISEILGTVMLATVFFSASGGALSKRAPKQCETQCEGDDHCFWQQVGRLIAIGLASAVLSGVPVALLSSLHSRKIKHVSCAGCREWHRQLKVWRVQDRVIWAVGVAYCLFAINYTILFFANVSSSDQLSWFFSAGIGFLEDLVLAPAIMAVTVPLLAFLLLVALSMRHKVRKEELVVPGKIDEVAAARAERRRAERAAMTKLGLPGDFATRIRELPAPPGDPSWDAEEVPVDISITQRYSEEMVQDLLRRAERRLLFAPVPGACLGGTALIRELHDRLKLWEAGSYEKLLQRVEGQVRRAREDGSLATDARILAPLLLNSREVQGASPIVKVDSRGGLKGKREGALTAVPPEIPGELVEFSNDEPDAVGSNCSWRSRRSRSSSRGAAPAEAGLPLAALQTRSTAEFEWWSSHGTPPSREAAVAAASFACRAGGGRGRGLSQRRPRS